MEDEIRAIRLEIEGKRDEWKQLAGKEQDRLLSLAPSEGSSSAALCDLKANINRCESTLNSWDEKRQTILALKSKKDQRSYISKIAKEFKPCRPKYMQKCIETSGNMSHSLDRRRAVGKSKDNAKRHYIQVRCIFR